MEVLLQKTLQGYLVPVSEDEAEKLRRIKVGATVRCEISRLRNAKFHRKYFALLKIAFDAWSETMTDIEYKGAHVQPNFNRFRRDIAILAGYFTPVFNVRGELRLSADSISFAGMDEETFGALYSKTIDVVLQKVIPQAGYDEDSLRAAVENVMGFA